LVFTSGLKLHLNLVTSAASDSTAHMYAGKFHPSPTTYSYSKKNLHESLKLICLLHSIHFSSSASKE